MSVYAAVASVDDPNSNNTDIHIHTNASMAQMKSNVNDGMHSNHNITITANDNISTSNASNMPKKNHKPSNVNAAIRNTAVSVVPNVGLG